MAPLGRSFGERNMFAGDVTMWRSFVVGSMTRKAAKARAWLTQKAW